MQWTEGASLSSGKKIYDNTPPLPRVFHFVSGSWSAFGSTRRKILAQPELDAAGACGAERHRGI
jgi:hypothetical protein